MKKPLILYFLISYLLSFGQDSASVQRNQFKFEYNKTYIPAALMSAGILFDSRNRKLVSNENPGTQRAHLFGFTNHVDDYAQFAPMVAIYAFEWAGMKPRTDWQNRTAILVKGQLVNLGLVYILKKTTARPRPDGTAFSFPSGHTANAFAGATMLAIEYGDEYKWVPYASYSFATGIGILRLTNNKHYFSDVLFGAGLGILSMKLAYWTHQYQWNRTLSSADPFAGIY